MKTATPESEPETGDLLDGRYRLQSKIGSGGMGVVYLARDEVLGRDVAVKMFRDPSADHERFSSETRLLACLNHHSLVTLFDARTGEQGVAFLVMEHVTGPTLRDRLRSGPIARGDVWNIAHDLAEALHVVHSAGIVHRDIKPSNVLLRPSPVPGEEFRAKLADFGIAYMVDSTRMTLPGTVLGTAAYLSPEQVRGEDAAPPSDVYSLGLVLIESLTGEKVYGQGTTHEAALARLAHDPVVPDWVGEQWRLLLCEMTHRDPSRRPSALDVVMRVGAFEPFVGTTLAGGTLGPSASDSTMELEVTRATPLTRTHQAPTGTVAGLPDPPFDALVSGRTDQQASDSGVDGHTSAPTASARRWPRRIAVAAAVASVLGIVLGVHWALQPASQAESLPQLPVLDEPLSSEMQQLLESVSP